MNPAIIAFVILTAMLAVSDLLAIKSKALLDSMLTFSVILTIAFWLGMSYDVIENSGFLTMAYVCLALLLTSMGSTITLEQFVREWKTVVIGFLMVALICVGVYFIGQIFVGKLTAYASAPVVAGGFVAYLTMYEPLMDAGVTNVAQLCLLTMIAQSLIGIPICSVIVKREAKRFIGSGEYKNFLTAATEDDKPKRSKLAFIPPIPEKYNAKSLILFKLAVVAALGCALSNAINGALNFLVCCLLMGIVFTQIGFLDSDAMTKAGMDGFILLVATVYSFEGVHDITPQIFVSLLAPFFIVMAIGVAVIFVGGWVLSKIFKVSFSMATAIGLTATFGFPATYYIAMEVANTGAADDAEKKTALENYLVPKMLVAGFATTSIGSVIAASIMLPGLMALL